MPRGRGQTARLRRLVSAPGKRVADGLVRRERADRPDRRNGRRCGKQARGQVAQALDGERRKPLHKFVLGDRAAKQEKLARNLRGAAGTALCRHDEPGAVLRARTVQFVLGNAFAGSLKFVDDHRDQLRNIALSGRRMHAEDAGVRKSPVEGIDRVAEAAFLAHFLEEPGRHAAAENHRQHLRGVKIADVIGAAFESEDDLGIHQVAVFAEVAADILRIVAAPRFRPCCGRSRAASRPRGRNCRA